jgi:hypothetical protein
MIPATTIRYDLVDRMGQKIKDYKRVPHRLSAVHKQTRVTISRSLLDLLHSLQHEGWKYVVTVDESWFYFSNQHEQISLPKDEDPPTNAQPMISSPKTMLSVVCNPHGFHVIGVLPKGCKYTSQSSIDNILAEICALHTAGDRNKLVIHADDARAHVSARVKQDMEEHGLRTAPHPSYSPVLAPSAFFLFGYVKRAIQGSEFQTVEELLAAVVGILNAVPAETLISAFHKWIRRPQTCIDTDGEYVE